MTLSNFICLTLITSLSLSFQVDSETNSPIVKFGNENRCMPKCLECQNSPNSCTKCTQGANCCNWACQKCQNQTQCKSCKQRFDLDTTLNICVLQQSCLTALCLECDDDKNICKQCQSGYYLNIEMKTCESCSPKCVLCSNAYVCSQCQDNMFLQDGVCKPCGQNCQKCNNSTICDRCVSEYFKNQNGKCQKCIQQCNKCTSRKDCIQCSSGHYFDQTINDCRPCIKPCLECTSQDVCISCQANSYFNKTTEKCLECDQIYSHCLNCQVAEVEAIQNLITQYSLQLVNKTTDTEVICKRCEAKYYLENSECKLCSEHCNQCNNSSTCITCSEYYFVNNQSQCTLCPIYRCFRCLNSTVCSICTSGTYWNPAISTYQCTKCSTGCTNCDQFGCRKCDLGFFLKNGNCYKCDSSCLRCTQSVFNCEACLTGYFKTTFMPGNCYKCPEPCIECSNSTYCTRCMPSYYLSKNICKKCKIQGCDQCRQVESNLSDFTIKEAKYQLEDTQKCIRCSFGYFLKDEKCQKCSQGCQCCSDIQSCRECSVHFYLNNENTTCIACTQHCIHCNPIKEPLDICARCDDGYSLNICNTLCLPCIENCHQCDTTQTLCYKCKDGYFENLLDQTVPGCQKCKSPCNNCEDENKCLSCVAGFYLNPKDICIKCQTGCEECNEEGCFLCEPTYRLNQVDLTCSKCKVQKCSKCQSSQTICETCEDGYQHFVPKGIEASTPICFRCDQKIDGCRTCMSPSWCTQCFSGLVLTTSSDGISNFCDQEDNDSPLGLLIAIGSLSLLVVVLTGVICVMKWKARKGRKEEDKKEKNSLIDQNSYSINSEEIISDRHLKRSLRSSFGDYQK